VYALVFFPKHALSSLQRLRSDPGFRSLRLQRFFPCAVLGYCTRCKRPLIFPQGRQPYSPLHWNSEVGNEVEVITGPVPIDRFIKDPLAGGDRKGGSAVLATAHEEVIDASERPVPISHQRVLRGEDVARFTRMCALPCVAVTDAHAAQGLTATPEADARRVGVGIESTGQHHVQTALTSDLLHQPCRCHLYWLLGTSVRFFDVPGSQQCIAFPNRCPK
jgi:hypothetical protein